MNNKPTTAETVRAAIARSKWLIIASLVVGLLAVNILRQAQGPQYQASADVLISTTDLGSVLTGTAPNVVDPERILDTEQTLAQSLPLYIQTASATRGQLGTARQIQAATSVKASSTNNILTFTASAKDPNKAIATANAVASEYIPWRAELSGRQIDRGIADLRKQIQEGAGNSNLTAQLNKLLVLKTLNSGNASLASNAVTAKKTRPTPVRDSLIGLSIGLVVALLLVGIREAFDTSARSEEEVESILNLPVIGSIPSLPRKTRMVTLGRHEAAFAGPFGLMAESLEQMREGKGQRVLAVTSATSKEGKSSTAANLAVALARRGNTVVLADLDQANPSMSGLFHIPAADPEHPRVAMNGSGPELWSIRLDGGPTPPVQDGIIVESGGGSLRVMPADAGPAERPARQRQVAKLIDRLRQTADWVIIDTPPALRSGEATALTRNVDMVLVVVRQGHVTRRNLRSLATQMRSWPARAVGAVVTDVDNAQPYSSTSRSN